MWDTPTPPLGSHHIFIENALVRCWKLTQLIVRLCRVPNYSNFLATKGSAGGFFEGWFTPKLGDRTLRRWSYSFAFSTFLNWHLPFVSSIFEHFQQKTLGFGLTFVLQSSAAYRFLRCDYASLLYVVTVRSSVRPALFSNVENRCFWVWKIFRCHN